jgi:antitoxin (DNA-binding transcriptional repressor) of toxin-antitoxin stability system
MLKVNLSQAKEQLETLIEAALKGETVVIEGDNEQDIRLVREEKNPERLSKRVPGSAKGLIKLAEDFDDPLPDFADYM